MENIKSKFKKNIKNIGVWSVSLPLVFILLLIVIFSKDIKVSIVLMQCGDVIGAEEQIDCLYTTLKDKVQKDGIEVGARIVSAAYMSEHFRNAFLQTGGGCHRHMHIVGDIAYYNLYNSAEGVAHIYFPQITTACGYAFFHGFIEHMIQDNPDLLFATETCESLKNRLRERMSRVGRACYHGVGHGFVRAQSELTTRNQQKDAHAFLDVPLARCETLPRATLHEKVGCKEGAFGAITQWIFETNDAYQLSVYREDPFLLCETFKEKDNRAACNTIVAPFLLSASEIDMSATLNRFLAIPDESIQISALQRSFDSIIQKADPRDKMGYTNALSLCSSFNAVLYEQCVSGIINALFVSGIPQKEYQRLFLFCSESSIEERVTRQFCYQKVFEHFSRYYTRQHIATICKQSPKDLQTMCLEQI